MRNVNNNNNNNRGDSNSTKIMVPISWQVLCRCSCLPCLSLLRSLFRQHPLVIIPLFKMAAYFSSTLYFSQTVINIWQAIYLTYYVCIVLVGNRQCKFHEGRNFGEFCLFCSLLVITAWKKSLADSRHSINIYGINE